MTGEIRPMRLMLKVVFLFIGANLIFAWLNPPVGKITLYNTIFPGRYRFPYEQEPQYYLAGYNAPIYEDFDAMFGAHVISRKKSENEFRVLLLGDSSTWGITVQAEDTLSEQINRFGLKTCDGRFVRVYNLGYPMPFLMRDLLILDKAMEYEPDLIVWLITLHTLESKSAETYFILPHAERYLSLVNRYQLAPLKLVEALPNRSLFDQTIIGKRRRLKNIFFVQAMGVAWAGTGIDNHEGFDDAAGSGTPPDVERDFSYGRMTIGDDPAPYFNGLRTDIILAGDDMAGQVPIVLVNQPMVITSGLNGEVRYNDIYPRWIYDAYRKFISEWSTTHGQSFLDFWNILPPEDFADRNFHRNASGEKRLAKQLAPNLEQFTCR